MGSSGYKGEYVPGFIAKHIYDSGCKLNDIYLPSSNLSGSYFCTIIYKLSHLHKFNQGGVVSRLNRMGVFDIIKEFSLLKFQ